MAEQADVLERPRDPEGGPAMRPQPRQRPALEPYLAQIGREHAGHQVEQRRLAGPVGADDGVDGAGADLEIDVAERVEAAEPFGQPGRLQADAPGFSHRPASAARTEAGGRCRG